MDSFITPQNYERKKEDMLAFLHSQVAEYIRKFGTREKLSKALGYSDNHVRLIYSRDPSNFTAIEKLWRECSALKIPK